MGRDQGYGPRRVKAHSELETDFEDPEITEQLRRSRSELAIKRGEHT